MVVLLVAAVATGLAIPAVLFGLRAHGVLDVPNDRSSHVQPVFRGGGLACLFGVACGLAVAEVRGAPVLWTAIALVIALSAVGFVDDIRGLAATPRLAAQAALGGGIGWLIWASPIGVLAGTLVLMIAVNVVNFMDGIDGISGMTVGVWGISATVLGVVHNSHALVPVGAVTAGAALGFLPVNFPTARLFLGDIGSYLLGALIGLGILVGARDGLSVVALVAPLSVYLADTTYTLLRRVMKRASLLTSHREHVYQRLVSHGGLSHPQVAILAAGASALVAVSWLPGFTLLGAGATVVILAVYLCSVTIVSWRPAAAAAHLTGGRQ